MPIQVRHIQYVIAAADHGSFRRASAVLGVQESAISRRIRDLEDRLGAALFVRSTGGVQLTQAGKQFLKHGREALSQVGLARTEVNVIGRGEDGEVRIGIFSSLASGFLFELLRTYAKNHAGVRVELIDGNPAEHVAAVRQLRLDVAFITGTAEWTDCDTERLWSERVFAVLPSEHPLTAKDELQWHDLSDESYIVSDAAPGPEIHDYLVQRLSDLGRHPEIYAQYVGRDVLLSMVAVGRGLTLTSEATTGAQIPGISYRPIANEVLPFSAIWSPRNDNPACRRLLSLARSMARGGSAAVTPAASGLPLPASLLQSPDPSQ